MYSFDVNCFQCAKNFIVVVSLWFNNFGESVIAVCLIIVSDASGIILGMGSANEKRCYNVTSSLIGWAHTQNDTYEYVILTSNDIDSQWGNFSFIHTSTVCSRCSAIIPGGISTGVCLIKGVWKKSCYGLARMLRPIMYPSGGMSSFITRKRY